MDGQKTIVDGDAIRHYIEDTAAEEGIDEHIRFHHRIVARRLVHRRRPLDVTAERTDTGETVELTCGFLFSCTGYYRYDHGYQPDFAGRSGSRGTIVHPQHWPEDLDFAGKRVVVIGSGATAVTLVPALADGPPHVTMLQRSPTYIARVPGRTRGRRSPTHPARQGAGTAVRWVHRPRHPGALLRRASGDPSR